MGAPLPLPTFIGWLEGGFCVAFLRNCALIAETDLAVSYDRVLYNTYLLAVCHYFSISFDVMTSEVAKCVGQKWG
jgi:hypothetical protein